MKKAHSPAKSGHASSGLKIPGPPEPKTVPISIKVQATVNEALAKAAAKHGRTRSAMAQAVLETWLREEGYLK
jgi:hypothetical protein